MFTPGRKLEAESVTASAWQVTEAVGARDKTERRIPLWSCGSGASQAAHRRTVEWEWSARAPWVGRLNRYAGNLPDQNSGDLLTS